MNHIAAPEIKQITGDNDNLFGKGNNIIVEFVGPTGCGKTTNCIQFVELLKSHNLNVYVFADIKEHLYRLNFFQRLHIYLHTISQSSHNLLFYILLLAKHGIFSFDSIYRYIKLCIFNSALEQFIAARKVDVVLLDQWIIQGLWSATIFKGKSHKTLSNNLKKLYSRADYVLYFEVDEETAAARIQSRDPGRSRFDRMPREKRLLELKRYNDYLYQLFQNSDCRNKYRFSTLVSPDENAKKFYRQLQQSLKPA